MYLINKYKINNKNDIKFHFNIYNKLLKKDNYDKIYDFLSSDNDYDKYYNKLINNEYKDYNDMSNLIIYGPKGSGKKTLINILLKDIYGYIPKLQHEIYNINYNGDDKEIEILQSLNHIIINPYNSALDKIIIQEIVLKNINISLIKTYNFKNKFRIILINNANNLSYNTQTSLRYIIEKYNKTCKFILCANSINKFIEPILSRCLMIQVPRPNKIELLNYLKIIINEQKMNIEDDIIKQIIKSSNRNIRESIWKLEIYNHKRNNKIININYNNIKYNKIIKSIYENKQCDLITFKNLREILYLIFSLNYNLDDFLTSLIQFIIRLLNNDNDKISNIIDYILKANIRINTCKKSVIHLETMTLKIIRELCR